MAYKYSRGAFVASGSVTLEEGLTVTGSSTLGALTTTTISGTQIQATALTASALDGTVITGLGINYLPIYNAGTKTFASSYVYNNIAGGSEVIRVSASTGITVPFEVSKGNITATGSVFSTAFISASSGLQGGGTSTLNDLTVNGNLTVLGTTISASVQNLIIEDKQIVLADGAANAATAAGAGFFVSGANVEWTYKQNGEGAAIGSGDIFVASGSTSLKSIQAKTFYGDLVGTMVSTVNSWGDVDQNPIVTGVNFANANFTVTHTWTLPSTPTTGSSVKIKGPSNLSPSVQLIVAAPAPYSIDGSPTAVLESEFAAIECVFVGGPSGDQWKIF